MQRLGRYVLKENKFETNTHIPWAPGSLVLKRLEGRGTPVLRFMENLRLLNILTAYKIGLFKGLVQYAK